ncbi:hypothetical protein O181_066714 [Austropuccinia psidii MF-1]|uniref:Uncharacterized protein n=1 Tax=Austropuccinia psidii MF-1 TaxID=1389203 RepID=A0A9Q3ETZ8_9BASI|nr:hypothetical protein [Austropuccinia psidii MF-1]
MRDSCVGQFTIIGLIGKNAVEVSLAEEFSMKHPVFPVSLVKPYYQKDYEKFPNRKQIVTHEKMVEEDDSPGPVKKIIKARKIRINGKGNRKYLFRINNQPENKDRRLSEKDIPDGKILLNRLRASRRTEESHQH